MINRSKYYLSFILFYLRCIICIPTTLVVSVSFPLFFLFFPWNRIELYLQIIYFLKVCICTNQDCIVAYKLHERFLNFFLFYKWWVWIRVQHTQLQKSVFCLQHVDAYLLSSHISWTWVTWRGGGGVKFMWRPAWLIWMFVTYAYMQCAMLPDVIRNELLCVCVWVGVCGGLFFFF